MHNFKFLLFMVNSLLQLISMTYPISLSSWDFNIYIYLLNSYYFNSIKTYSCFDNITWIFFFLNNYKIQTILLVSQGLKLFWFLTIRVQRTWFWGYKSSILYSISSCASSWVGQSVHVGRKSSPKESFFVHWNCVQYTCFLFIKLKLKWVVFCP